MRCLVVGFTEIRSAFFFTSNVPNPCMDMTLPSSNCRVILDSKDATNSEVSFSVYPNLRDNSEVNSLLFKIQTFKLNYGAILAKLRHIYKKFRKNL